MKKKILVFFCGIFLLLAAGSVTVCLYYYTHPDSLKPLIEKALSDKAGTGFSIRKLSYEVNPLRIEMVGVHSEESKDSKAPKIEVKKSSARLAFEGPFGKKSLVFKEIEVKDFSISISQETRLPGPQKDVRKESRWWSKILERLIGLFLFTDIEIETVRATKGRITVSLFNKELIFEGITAVLRDDQTSEITCEARLRWPQKRLELIIPRLRMLPAGPFSLKGDVKGRIEAENAALESPEVDIRDIEIRADLVYEQRNSTLDLEELELSFKGIRPKKSYMRLLDLEVNAKGLLDLKKRELELLALYLEVPQLLELEGELQAGFASQPKLSLQILKSRFVANEMIQLLRKQVPGSEFKTLPSISGSVNIKGNIRYPGSGKVWEYDLEAFLGENSISLSGNDLEAEGKISARVNLQGNYPGLGNITRHPLGRLGGLSLVGQVQTKELSFETLGGNFLGENLSINANIRGDFSQGTADAVAPVFLEIHKGEVLYDRYYLNLDKNRFSSSLLFRLDLPQRSFYFSKIHLLLKDIISLDLKGVVGGKKGNRQIDLRLSIPETSAAPIFKHFLLGPYQAEAPLLNTLEIGGKVSVSLELKSNGANSGGMEVKGHCFWNEGRLYSEDKGICCKGISMDLPLWYRSSGGKGTRKLERGKLSIESLQVPMLPEQALHVGLRAGTDSLFLNLKDPLRVPGGTISLEPLVFQEPFSKDRSFETSVSIDITDLRPILSGLVPLQDGGSIKGKLDSVRFSGGNLDVRGAIKARIFDGNIFLYDLGVRSLFTSGPVFKVSASLDHLNLKKMTAGTSFGKIEGILEGYVRQLEIAYGQPQRFDLFLETVEEEGIRQRISVRAVDNIARIGGGSSPFLGIAGVFSSFFNEFPYKKIGVRSSLENDVFEINGTIKEEGTEYIVKRGSFSGVNIVNRNPENRISFKDMMKRIKRVTASEGSGPMIKQQ